MSDESSCQVCKKTQSQLPNPLKNCAKCHTQAYCSRECQKNDWKEHKKQCGTNHANSQPPTASKNPKEQILEQAELTVAFMQALSHEPHFNTNLAAIPPSAIGLKYICDFVGRTFREYWPAILPPQKYAELSAELTSFHGIEKEDQLRNMAAKFEETKNREPSFDKDAWPKLDHEKYDDCFTRNFTAAKIVLTPNQQAMMGGRYPYSEDVKEVCKKLA